MLGSAMKIAVNDVDLAARSAELAEQGVDTVRVTYADVHGIARGKDIALPKFGEVTEHGLAFCAASLFDGLSFSLADLPARSVEPTYPDMRVRVLPASLVRVPWERTTAWCLAEVDAADKHISLCSRHLLVQALAAFRALGLTVIAAPELESYVLQRDAQGRFIRLENASALPYAIGEHTDPSGLLCAIVRCGNEIGLDITTAHHECGRGQYEINLNHGDALAAADRAFRFKQMVKELAAREGLWATFMGKPFADDAGSGFHLHLSVHDETGNRFDDPRAMDGLSRLAKHFLAGVLAHAAGLTAFYCPTINSYKRLVPRTLVPTRADWDFDDRNAYVRVPPERGQATRLELRAADAAANPYLVIAVTLLAGLDGIKRELEPPAPREESGNEQVVGGPLPIRLEQSLEALKQDTYLVEAVGRSFVDAYCAVKSAEAERYRLHVSEWEIKEYAWHL
jgi:glutamine synthetase